MSEKKMTQEQALKLLEHPIYKWSMDWDERDDGLNYTEAIEIAIAALRPVSREQVEKVCGEWLNFYNDFSTAECSKCGELFDVSDTNENLKVLFDAFKKYYQFCPSCGAPMTDEAVEITMRRLEAIFR